MFWVLGKLTLRQVHDSHANAGDEVPQAILTDVVVGQPGEDGEPGKKPALQPGQRTPEAREERDGWGGRKWRNRSGQGTRTRRRERNDGGGGGWEKK